MYIEYIFGNYQNIIISFFCFGSSFFYLFFEVVDIVVFEGKMGFDVYMDIVVDIGVVVFVVNYYIMVSEQCIYNRYNILVIKVE